MELTAEQQLLLALYIESKEDKPNMDKITSQYLGMDNEVFLEALNKLEMRRYLINFNPARGGRGNKIKVYWLSDVCLEKGAIKEAEELLDSLKLQGNTSEGITIKIFKTFKEDIKDIIAKYFAELNK